MSNVPSKPVVTSPSTSTIDPTKTSTVATAIVKKGFKKAGRGTQTGVFVADTK